MKTPEEMLKYAKNIVDTDEHACVRLFVRDWEHLTKLPDIYTNRQQRLYQGKGVLRVCVIPKTLDEAIGTYCMTQPTHLFITSRIDTQVLELLKSRVRDNRKLVEPSGIYYPTHVERWESY